MLQKTGASKATNLRKTMILIPLCTFHLDSNSLLDAQITFGML